MQFSQIIALFSLAAAAAACGGASGCCCYDFNSGVMWVQNGTTAEEVSAAEASGSIPTGVVGTISS